MNLQTYLTGTDILGSDTEVEEIVGTLDDAAKAIMTQAVSVVRGQVATPQGRQEVLSTARLASPAEMVASTAGMAVVSPDVTAQVIDILNSDPEVAAKWRGALAADPKSATALQKLLPNKQLVPADGSFLSYLKEFGGRPVWAGSSVKFWHVGAALAVYVMIRN